VDWGKRKALLNRLFSVNEPRRKMSALLKAASK
jgi:hypothetical protein